MDNQKGQYARPTRSRHVNRSQGYIMVVHTVAIARQLNIMVGLFQDGKSEQSSI